MMTVSENCKRVETCIQNGKGQCQIKHLTDKAAMYDHARMFAHVTIPAGCSIGDHPHVDETEFYYIIKGEAVFNDNGKEVILHAGDIGATGYGEGHGLENRSDEPVEMIALIIME